MWWFGCSSSSGRGKRSLDSNWHVSQNGVGLLLSLHGVGLVSGHRSDVPPRFNPNDRDQGGEQGGWLDIIARRFRDSIRGFFSTD